MTTEDMGTPNWSQTGIDPNALGVRREDDPEAYLKAYRKAYSELKKRELSDKAAAKYAEKNREVIEARLKRRELRKAEQAKAESERRAEAAKVRELARPARAALSAAKKRESGLKRRAKDKLANPEKYHERRVKKVKWASWDEFKPFYEEAKRLRQYTGQMWDVEHIYPIKSDWVCGLHTPDNLRISARSENMRKGNRPIGTLGDELWDLNHYSVYWPGEELTMAQKRDTEVRSARAREAADQRARMKAWEKKVEKERVARAEARKLALKPVTAEQAEKMPEVQAILRGETPTDVGNRYGKSPAALVRWVRLIDPSYRTKRTKLKSDKPKSDKPKQNEVQPVREVSCGRRSRSALEKWMVYKSLKDASHRAVGGRNET